MRVFVIFGDIYSCFEEDLVMGPYPPWILKSLLILSVGVSRCCYHCIVVAVEKLCDSCSVRICCVGSTVHTYRPC